MHIIIPLVFLKEDFSDTSSQIVKSVPADLTGVRLGCGGDPTAGLQEVASGCVMEERVRAEDRKERNAVENGEDASRKAATGGRDGGGWKCGRRERLYEAGGGFSGGAMRDFLRSITPKACLSQLVAEKTCLMCQPY